MLISTSSSSGVWDKEIVNRRESKNKVTNFILQDSIMDIKSIRFSNNQIQDEIDIYRVKY
jgi:hypothetical protein